MGPPSDAPPLRMRGLSVGKPPLDGGANQGAVSPEAREYARQRRTNDDGQVGSWWISP